MKSTPRQLLGLGLALLASSCSLKTPPAPVDYSPQVAALAAEAQQHLMGQSPFLQVRAGKLIGELPDITPEQASRDVAFARSLLARLKDLPANDLVHEDALTVAMLRWETELAIEADPFYWLTFPYTPYSAGFSINFVHQQIAAHPFSDPEAHPANYLQVLSEYADQLEQFKAHVKGQGERGIYLSRHALPGVVGLFQAFRAQAPALMTVQPERLSALSEEQRAKFQAAAQTAIADRILPAFDGFLAALESEDYQAHAPEAVGLAQYPDGERYYRLLVKAHTTLDVSPEALHALGKKRLEEIEAKMAAIRAEVGFGGSQEEFHVKLRTDPQFFAKTPEEVEARFNTYIARIEPLLPQYFRTIPKAPYGVKRLEPATEATMTFGFYQAPTPDEKTGLYRYNGSKLDQRPQIWSGPLIYHELVPGHHFHFALQNENTALSHFRRNYLGSTAFNEGWGNYGATLAGEMGLLNDPYDRYGAALFDAFISARLVLDTGMNLMGWSLEQGRDYMAAHTFQSQSEIETETLRYATDLNGQALAYKAGLEKLVELREKAKAKSGEKFDIRNFHDAVLSSGAMPMMVLERHVDWYFDQH